MPQEVVELQIEQKSILQRDRCPKERTSREQTATSSKGPNEFLPLISESINYIKYPQIRSVLFEM